MRTISLLTAIASIVLITLSSCKKAGTQQNPVTQTINASVKVNETYSFTLPANESPDPFTIIKQSGHSSVSVIEKNETGNFVYSYSPSANFNGTDQVILSNERNAKGNCEHPGCNHQGCNHGKPHHNNCQHNETQTRIIVINFALAADNVVITSTTRNNTNVDK